MDSKSIYTLLLPHCKPGYEKTLWLYVCFCISKSNSKETPGCERHHILPKSIIPGYSNLRKNPWNEACLSYRDHYKAHLFLARCVHRMKYAIWYMSNYKHSSNYRITEEEYERNRIAFSKLVRGRKASPETRRKQSESKKGNKYAVGTRWPEESKKKKSIVMQGNKNLLGYKHTDETKKRQSKALKGRVHEKITCPHCGKTGGKAAMKRYHFDNCKTKT